MAAPLAIAAIGLSALQFGLGLSRAKKREGQLNKLSMAVMDAAYKNAKRARVELEKFKSTQRVVIRKNGIILTGSAVDLIDETERVGSEEIQNMITAAQIEAQAIRADARTQMTDAILGGGLNFGATLIERLGKS